MKKLVFIIGLAAGYVIGTRQGREGYENLKKRASDLWRNPKVKKTVNDVQDAVSDKVPAASDAVSDAVRKADTKADDVAASSTPAEELPGNV
jgi:hypothetical protein